MKRLNKNRDISRIKEGWGLFFVLGIVMLNYPFLHIFNKPDTIFGIPLMVLYLFVGWPISIGIIYIFATTLGVPKQGPEQRSKRDKGND